MIISKGFPLTMPRLIGITGTIGSGKSAVGQILSSFAVPVIDSDRIVHELLTEPTPVREAVVTRFGKEILKANGTGGVDRERLGKLVFADAAARRDLESIVHPAVLLECSRRVDQHSGEPLVALLVPLLFEAAIESQFDEVWTVITDEAALRLRLKERDNLGDDEVDRRLAAQLSQSEKASRSDRVIDNSGSLEDTREQIITILQQCLN